MAEAGGVGVGRRAVQRPGDHAQTEVLCVFFSLIPQDPIERTASQGSLCRACDIQALTPTKRVDRCVRLAVAMLRCYI